ncbi:MAG TPA: ABC transporter substrate-binding protein [Spirochaetia bacterium]|nr:ABC transporter substrate-binding protein [Spirochaetia bacterium]
MKRISWKFMIAVVVMLAAAFGFASNAFASGSTEKSPQPASSAPAMSGPTTVTLLIDNQTSLNGIKAVAAAAEKKLNIKLNIDLRPGGDAGDNLVRTRLATGEMDDISFYNSGSLFQELHPNKFFVDLTNEPYMSNVLASYKKTVEVNGQVYQAPGQTVMGGGWLYNRKVYAQLGLSVPKTWNELIANSQKIKAAGITPILASYKDSWTAQLIPLADFYNVQQADPTFAADFTANKAKFADTPAALSGFQKLQQVFKLGLINSDAASTTYNQALQMLLDGKGGQYPMLTFAFANLESMDAQKAQDIGFFAQPGDSASSNGLTLWMPAGFSVYNQSKNVDAAKKWIAYFESTEGIDTFMSAEKPGGPFAVKGIKLPDNILPGVKDMLPYVDGGNTAPALEFVSPLKGPNLPQICVSDGLGLETPTQAAQDYDKDVQKQAKQLGLPGW